jgi:hypothetical protein
MQPLSSARPPRPPPSKQFAQPAVRRAAQAAGWLATSPWHSGVQVTAKPGNLLAVTGFVTSCLLLLQFFLLRATLQSTASRHSL